MSMNSAGIWIDSLEVAAAIQRALAGVGHAAVPHDKQFLQNRTIMFIPHSQVEWILSQTVLAMQ
jgi:hypothetical protein